jgi:hypothetical protein
MECHGLEVPYSHLPLADLPTNKGRG